MQFENPWKTCRNSLESKSCKVPEFNAETPIWNDEKKTSKFKLVTKYSIIYFPCMCPINRKLVAIRTVVSNAKYERGCKSGRVGFGRTQ